MSRGEILARAYLGLSFGYAERNTKPEYALKLVQRAKTHAHGLEDEAAKARCLADCADCEGWILYKQDEIDEAIERLEDAVALNADPEKHLHLALVYEHKAQKCEDETRARSLSTRARTHHRHVRNMDTKDEYSQEADESLSRLK